MNNVWEVECTTEGISLEASCSSSRGQSVDHPDSESGPCCVRYTRAHYTTLYMWTGPGKTLPDSVPQWDDGKFRHYYDFGGSLRNFHKRPGAFIFTMNWSKVKSRLEVLFLKRKNLISFH